MRTEPRFPRVRAGAPYYESFYIKATSPDGGRGVWIRYTVHKRPAADATAALWLTYFDAAAELPRAAKSTVAAGELAAPEDAFIAVGPAVIGPGRAQGEIASETLNATWDLSFAEGAEPLRHLNYDRLYRTRLPRTKLESPYPATAFDGELTLDGDRISIARWPGMVGHNWGAEHAERWVWIQANALGGRDGDYIDLAAGRIKIGPWTSPWIANGRIVLDGEPRRIGGLDRVYGTEVHAEPTGCEFTFPGKDVSIRGRVGARKKDFVAWRYADPKGPEHETLNCSIADLKLTVERPRHSAAMVELSGGAAYELGSRGLDHGIALQPYSDG
jgi:hypothetical protein